MAAHLVSILFPRPQPPLTNKATSISLIVSNSRNEDAPYLPFPKGGYPICAAFRHKVIIYPYNTKYTRQLVIHRRGLSSGPRKLPHHTVMGTSWM